MKWNDIASCVKHCSHSTRNAFDTVKSQADEQISVEVHRKGKKYIAEFSAYLGQGHTATVRISRDAKHSYSIVSDGDLMPGFTGRTLKELGKAFIRAVRKHGVHG